MSKQSTPLWDVKEEDEKGIPYYNSFGPLSDKSREILARKPCELTVERAPRTGPYA